MSKGRISPLAILPPLIFVGLAVMFLWGMNREDPTALPSTREGHPAPALTVVPLGDLKPFGPEDLRDGQVKLVNFWASWCVACRAEHEQLMRLSEEGVMIYGIDYKDEPAKGLGYLARYGNPYARTVADPTGRTGIEWGLYGVPETFVIDGKGIVIKRFAGPITPSVLENIIRPAMQRAAAN